MNFIGLKKGEKLFKESSDYYEYSYFGWRDLNLQLHGYIRGYKESADSLVEIALKSESIVILDTYVYPICFLYRHSLELVLKSIFLRYSSKTSEEKVAIIGKVSHSLEKIWKEVKQVIERYCFNEEKADIEIAEDYIMQFDYFDKDSFSFRYPITKRLELIHNKWNYLDLDNLRQRMSELHNFFGGVDAALSDRRDAEVEMLKYMADII